VKAKIVIMPDGSVQIVVEEGEYAQASARLSAFVENLKLSGLKFTSVGVIEQHRHGPEHIHTHDVVRGN
jgi:hypothetical protein